MPAGLQEDNAFFFEQGKTVTITANSKVSKIGTDVDLYVFRGNVMIASDVSIGPNSRVEFVVPAAYHLAIGHSGAVGAAWVSGGARIIKATVLQVVAWLWARPPDAARWS